MQFYLQLKDTIIFTTKFTPLTSWQCTLSKMASNESLRDGTCYDFDTYKLTTSEQNPRIA